MLIIIEFKYLCIVVLPLLSPFNGKNYEAPFVLSLAPLGLCTTGLAQVS
jgi:hypothetical protein